MQKNQIEVAGFLAAKPTVRMLPSATKVANVRLAEGYQYTDRQTKALREHTNWHNLVFYGVLADIAATYDKGDNVYVEGSLQTRQFTPKDGSQRTVYEVIAKTCHLIGAPRSKQESLTINEPGVGPDIAPDLQTPGGADQNEWPA